MKIPFHFNYDSQCIFNYIQVHQLIKSNAKFKKLHIFLYNMFLIDKVVLKNRFKSGHINH